MESHEHSGTSCGVVYVARCAAWASTRISLMLNPSCIPSKHWTTKIKCVQRQWENRTRNDSIAPYFFFSLSFLISFPPIFDIACSLCDKVHLRISPVNFSFFFLFWHWFCVWLVGHLSWQINDCMADWLNSFSWLWFTWEFPDYFRCFNYVLLFFYLSGWLSVLVGICDWLAGWLNIDSGFVVDCSFCVSSLIFVYGIFIPFLRSVL